MTIKINDEDFSSPAVINLHPCLTSSRYLSAVQESVIITNCCQDPNNPALVIIDFTLVGAYIFQPYVNIISVDENTSYSQHNIRPPLAVGHYKNVNIPINTACSTYYGQLVYDFGKVIDNFLSAQLITFELVMVGSVPLAYGVSYPSQTITASFDWNKGVLPSPVNLLYNEGFLSVVFEYKGTKDCSCDIQCVIPTGVGYNVQFCPDEQQNVILYQGDTSGDPYSVLIQLRDSIGNISSLEFQSLFTSKPLPPSVSVGTKPKRIDITISRQSVNFVSFDETLEYQVLRYRGKSSNAKIWKDWSHINWNHFVDYDVIPGETYGYALRFKGKFNEVSNLSDWTEVTI